MRNYDCSSDSRLSKVSIKFCACLHSSESSPWDYSEAFSYESFVDPNCMPDSPLSVYFGFKSRILRVSWESHSFIFCRRLAANCRNASSLESSPFLRIFADSFLCEVVCLVCFISFCVYNITHFLLIVNSFFKKI